ncbi:class I SAM-dependent methyltransferase [Candidatus Bathyarchaeota archaeon]|jgi:predicted SAM-dependent methyltransferase|nr:class I SAM-dependent methyltransferase [Candidatus Bathyarchaeota archaeon]
MSETLDVGCGKRKQGTVNIDLDRRVRPDIVCDMLFLPFRREAFSRIILTFVVEHTIKPRQLMSACTQTLRPEGTIEISFPNVASFTVLLDWLMKEISYSESLLLGDPASSYLAHRALYTVSKVERLLLAHGFQIEKIVGHPPSVGPRLLRLLGVLLVNLFPKRAGTVTIIARKMREKG